MELPQLQKCLLKYAEKYIWWETAEFAVQYPYRVIAQVMDIGTLEDTNLLTEEIPYEDLVKTVKTAQAGWFRPQSRYFWHNKLNLVHRYEDVPPLPVRRFD